VMKS